MIDIGKQFVRSTYNIEGDGAYGRLLRRDSEITKYNKLCAVSQSLAPGNTLAQQQDVAYAMSCVQPGIDYFQLKSGDDTKPPLSQFNPFSGNFTVTVSDINSIYF